MIQIKSTQDPFTSVKLGASVLTTMGRADAMGLLPQDENIETLDLASVQTIINHIHRAGIGKAIHLTAADNDAALETIFQRLNQALEESPAPEFEWERLTEILGLDLLARLLGTAVPSIRRYKAGSRVTPDGVANRLHLLTLVVGDLSGAYNEAGIRQWFDRRRAQLGGKSPAELLAQPWVPDDPRSAQVRDLARALAASPVS